MDPARREDDFQRRDGGGTTLEHIAEGGSGGGSDDTDALRIAGDWAVFVRHEQALGIELLLEPLERELQRAYTLKFHRGDPELILPARFIDGQFALEQDVAPVFGADPGRLALRRGKARN